MKQDILCLVTRPGILQVLIVTAAKKGVHQLTCTSLLAWFCFTLDTFLCLTTVLCAEVQDIYEDI